MRASGDSSGVRRPPLANSVSSQARPDTNESLSARVNANYYSKNRRTTHTHKPAHTQNRSEDQVNNQPHPHTHTEGLDTWPTRLCAAAKTFAERCPASGETFDVRRGTCNRIITHTRAQAQTRATHTLLRTRHHERCVSSQDTHDAS